MLFAWNLLFCCLRLLLLCRLPNRISHHYHHFYQPNENCCVAAFPLRLTSTAPQSSLAFAIEDERCLIGSPSNCPSDGMCVCAYSNNSNTCETSNETGPLLRRIGTWVVNAGPLARPTGRRQKLRCSDRESMYHIRYSRKTRKRGQTADRLPRSP